MESYRIEHLTFAYPNQTVSALDDITLTIAQGEFIVLCGKSGCGKSTLLRQLKTVLSPHGKTTGKVYFQGQLLSEIDTQSADIGFVLQNPDNQIVTDKVWHELAFGLESLGCSTPEIRARVAEMASFFGIQTWFHKKVTELSGGQKQLLNLASIMVMQPKVLILDEPTSQLDPIAAQDFLETVAKINRELGVTIILTEHRLEDVFPMADRVLVMDSGKIIADGTPRETGETLRRIKHDMYTALPAPMQIYACVPNTLDCPVTVREGRKWLEELSHTQKINPSLILQQTETKSEKPPMIELRDIWFRYDKNLPDIIKGLSMRIDQGELYAIVGGNGTGKTTTLSIIQGLRTPYRGDILLNGRKSSRQDTENSRLTAVLPQNPQALFVKKTVKLDLMEVRQDSQYTKSEWEDEVQRIVKMCELEELVSRHPYDLSGGEQQRAALAKVLLLRPKILLLDEPTKGLDAHFKETFADILAQLKYMGTTIIMVSHDIEFCAKYADRCAMFFDGALVSEGTPREFFAGKSFYTTAVNRMARMILPNAVLTEDVILACGGTTPSKTHKQWTDEMYVEKKEDTPCPNETKRSLTLGRIVLGGIFGILFILTLVLFHGKYEDWRNYLVQFATIAELGLCLLQLVPQNRLNIKTDTIQIPKEKRGLRKRTLATVGIVLFLIPLTIYIGNYYLGDRKYYFISLLIILETLIPFCAAFEKRKPQARELVIIGVLCAIAVAGRAAFFMLPQFKPVIALVIITGVCMGAETGFLVGAITGFISNFFFGQGPWTPWQMFVFGLIGFIAGVLFQKGFLRKTKGSLALFGILSALVIYGGIMNPASVLIWQAKPNMQMIISAYIMGFPLDLIHAAATAFFLWFISAPMIEKLDRVKLKYGLIKDGE